MPEQPPMESGTRIGCGALVGVLVGLVLVTGVGLAGFADGSRRTLVTILVLSIVVCALLGWRLGDRFFQSLARWLPWLQ
jgi:hypothetical protein